jgi:nucleotide-binding universal stress UspA family protein
MHVLLALDGSDASLEATRQLVELPFKEKPKVTLVTALVGSNYDLVPNEKSDTLHEAEHRYAFEHFQRARALLEPKFQPIEHVVERKHPRRLILETAASRKVDLMVLGARGHSGIHRIVLGSTADYIANHSECSVMIARPVAGEAAPDFTREFRILLAYDGSRESKVAYSQMCEFDWPQEETAIHIAMVLERPQMIPDDVVYDPEQIAEQEAALRDLNLAEQFGCKIEHTVCEALHVGHAVRSMALDDQSNIVFVGGTGKSAIARFFLGSTSRYFLHHAECTMWIARENQWQN